MDGRSRKLGFQCDVESEFELNFNFINSFYKFFENFSWEGVNVKKYKADDGSWLGVRRYEIVKTDKIHFRYFEIDEGGYSTLEKHEHEHIVMCIRGSGIVVFGSEFRRMKPYDVVHIKSWQVHQFIADKEIFGFVCVVPAKRDKPTKLSEEEINELLKQNPSLKGVIRF